MKFQLVAPDNRVGIDGKWVSLNLPGFGLHPAYHAVQFDGERGEIEWVAVAGVKPPNMPINRDQLMAMFGPIIEAAKVLIAAQEKTS